MSLGYISSERFSRMPLPICSRGCRVSPTSSLFLAAWRNILGPLISFTFFSWSVFRAQLHLHNLGKCSCPNTDGYQPTFHLKSSLPLYHGKQLTHRFQYQGCKHLYHDANYACPFIMPKYFLSTYDISHITIGSTNENNQEKNILWELAFSIVTFLTSDSKHNLNFPTWKKKSLYLRRYQIVSENKQIVNCTILPEASSLNQLQKLWKE